MPRNPNMKIVAIRFPRKSVTRWEKAAKKAGMSKSTLARLGIDRLAKHILELDGFILPPTPAELEWSRAVAERLQLP